LEDLLLHLLETMDRLINPQDMAAVMDEELTVARLVIQDPMRAIRGEAVAGAAVLPPTEAEENHIEEVTRTEGEILTGMIHGVDDVKRCML
jgi:hypothetical protein